MARAQWGTRLGFILSGIGGAVGLGNIWRFPQLTSENGGAAFVFVYVPLLLFMGIPLLWAELAIGQRGQLSPAGSFGRVAGRAWRRVGLVMVGATLLFMSYYTVIAGLALKYVLFAPSEQLASDPSGFLADSAEGQSALLFHALFAAITALVVSFGVSKGLERANFVMMPGLFGLVIALAVYALFQDGAADGVRFYLRPDLGEIDLETVQLALGQVFFSVGIGFGLMLTFASYVPKGRSMASSATTIALADLGVALTAGLMIFPLAFSQGLQGEIVGETANQTTALFITMPAAFAAIGGAFGKLLLLAFFLMLAFAALSSSIAGLEVLVSHMEDSWGVGRRRAAALTAMIAYGVGITAALSSEVSDRMDLLLGNVFLFATVVLMCIVFAVAIEDRTSLLLGDQENAGPLARTAARIVGPLVAYVLPVVLVIVFVLNLPGTWRGLFG